MKLKDMPIEEIELMSYTDLTYALLKENGKFMMVYKSCDLAEVISLLDLNAVALERE